MPKKWVKFNINENIKVKLTDAGHNVMMRNHLDFWDGLRGTLGPKFTPAKEDEEGWSLHQMWCLLEKLGLDFGMGRSDSHPFETNIMIEIDEEDILESHD